MDNKNNTFALNLKKNLYYFQSVSFSSFNITKMCPKSSYVYVLFRNVSSSLIPDRVLKPGISGKHLNSRIWCDKGGRGSNFLPDIPHHAIPSTFSKYNINSTVLSLKIKLQSYLFIIHTGY